MFRKYYFIFSIVFLNREKFCIRICTEFRQNSHRIWSDMRSTQGQCRHNQKIYKILTNCLSEKNKWVIINYLVRMGFKLLRFQILLEPRPHFKNGDRVNCILNIELNGSLKCKHIFVTAIGEIVVWYNGQRRHFKQIPFMTIPMNFRELVNHEFLETGAYRIPFEFHLTNAIYPSFESKNGRVVYYIEAMTDTGMLYTPESTRTFIKVKNHSNMFLINPRPVSSTRERMIRILGLKMGMIRLSAHLDKNIFDCGETIYIGYHLDNRSTKSIRFVPQLVVRTTFAANNGYNSQESGEKLMASNYAEVCPENSSQSDIICIPIPYDAISSIGSDLIEIIYFIKLFVDISGGAEYFDNISIIIK